MKKLCEECTFGEVGKKFDCCEDPDEQFELKVLMTKMIMDKCVECDYWKDPRPMWNEDICNYIKK